MTRWDALPATARLAVEAECGGAVYAVEPAPAGSVSEFAATLHSASGAIFCKAVTVDNPRCWMHRNEARITPWLAGIAPQLRWQVETGGWLLLGFAHVPGRHADLTPGSEDLIAVAELADRLATSLTPAPVPARSLAERWGRLPVWARYCDQPPPDLDPWTRAHLPYLAECESAAPGLIHGQTLVHTDPTAENLLVAADGISVVDWAWPAQAAAWVDVAFLVMRLTATGHSPAAAEQWAEQVPCWADAAPRAVTAFAAAAAGIREYRTRTHQAPHPHDLAATARDWLRHRMDG